MLTTHRKSIKDFLGVKIEAPDRMHYRILNPEALALESLANELLKSIQNFVFLQEFRELGNLIQPEQIDTGSRYLQQIGRALAEKRKLSITYQKFTDQAPYDAIMHPYCLKADKGRWYIFAHKERGEHEEYIQCFALDRTSRLEVMPETFVPNPEVDLDAYFRDCFGVWHDYEKYPVRDITISCTKEVANYLRTLPLHRSQREDPYREGEEERVIFHYHLSPSPDFIGELKKWDNGIRIKDEKKKNQQII
jgi:predicted DNA-binding transcriptional regulator YafY